MDYVKKASRMEQQWRLSVALPNILHQRYVYIGCCVKLLSYMPSMVAVGVQNNSCAMMCSCTNCCYIITHPETPVFIVIWNTSLAQWYVIIFWWDSFFHLTEYIHFTGTVLVSCISWIIKKNPSFNHFKYFMIGYLFCSLLCVVLFERYQ